MSALLVVFTYNGQDEMVARHMAGYRRSGADVLISSPVDAPSQHGGVCYALSQRAGPELLKRMWWTYRHVLKMTFDTFAFVEGDSIVCGAIPENLTDGLHCYVWDNTDPNFRGRQYAHWPHLMNRRTLQNLSMAADYADPFLEYGWPDRAVGTLCEDAGIPLIHRPDLAYSRNLIDRDQYFEEAQAAIDVGAVFVHGLKEAWQLERLRLPT